MAGTCVIDRVSLSCHVVTTRNSMQSESIVSSDRIELDQNSRCAVVEVVVVVGDVVLVVIRSTKYIVTISSKGAKWVYFRSSF